MLQYLAGCAGATEAAGAGAAAGAPVAGAGAAGAGAAGVLKSTVGGFDICASFSTVKFGFCL
jgi:hypothetical protein